MGDTRGFLRWPRQSPPERPIAERLRDWKEVYRTQPDSRLEQQAGRCMDCGIPFCQQGCPIGNLIPDWNDAVYRGDYQLAYQRLCSTNNFPEFTGRLCPAPCEAACVLTINTEAVTIEAIEKDIIEHAFAQGWVIPRPPQLRTPHRVAVVGSGPAGLAAAAQLNSVGHAVTVYEAKQRVGGLLRYGIPDFKLEKWVIDRRVALMQAEGITFHTGTPIGSAVTYSQLLEEFDALLIAVGASRPRELAVPGRDLDGVHLAMDYLCAQNEATAHGQLSSIDARGKRVTILGGGDTGSDCLGTALRQGAETVAQIELLPAPGTERGPDDLWPGWPFILRTSSSQAEGGTREFALRTDRLEGSAGQLTGLQASEVVLETSDERPTLRDTGKTRKISVDFLILAMGFVGAEADQAVAQLDLQLDQRGCIRTPSGSSYATDTPGVFCAGDARRGASLIVWAIAEGREAARQIDMYLRQDDRPRLATRGIDQPF